MMSQFKQVSFTVSWIIFFSFYMCTYGVSQKDSKTVNVHEFSKFIDELADQSEYNGSILVQVADSIQLQKQYGFQSAARQTLIDEQSMYNLGSISKNICTYALYLLIKKDLLQLDHPISNFLPQLPSWSDNITVDQIVHHESGLPERRIRRAYTDANLEEELGEITQLFTDTTLYSNYNNFLQAKIIEKITNRPLHSFVQQEIFDPLNMFQSIYTSYPPDGLKHETRSFSKTMGDDILNNPYVLEFDLCYAPIYMSAKDLLRWTSFLLSELNEGIPSLQPFYSKTTQLPYGPFGKIVHQNGIINEFETAGQAYHFIIHVFYDRSLSTTLILMSNNKVDQLHSRLKNEIFDRVRSMQ